jgi:hypothetical protein
MPVEQGSSMGIEVVLKWEHGISIAIALVIMLGSEIGRGID